MILLISLTASTLLSLLSIDTHEDLVNKELLSWGRDQLGAITASNAKTEDGLIKVVLGVL